MPNSSTVNLGTKTGNTAGSLENALTNYYFPRMWEEIKVSAPGFEFFKDLSSKVEWGPGYTGTFPIRTKSKRGMLGGTTGRLPVGGTPEYSMATVNYTVFRQLISFLWDAKLASGHERYIKNLLDSLVDDVKLEYLRRFNTYLYTGANQHTISTNIIQAGCVATLQATFSSGNTVKVKAPYAGGNMGENYRPYGAHYLQPGDTICITNETGGLTTTSGQTAQFFSIASISRSYGSGYATLTLNETFDTDVGSFDPNAPVYLASALPSSTTHAGGWATAYEQTDAAAGLLGLANVAGDATYLGKTRGGMWSTTGLVGDVPGTVQPLSFARMDEVILKMNEQLYTKPDLAIMQSGMWHEYVDLTEGGGGGFGNHAFRNASEVPGGHSPSTKKSYFTAHATTGQGDLKILVDPYAPHNTVTFVATDHIGYATVQAAAEAADDGSFLRMSSSTHDEWFGFMRWAGQFLSESPAAVGILADVTQDVVAI